MSLDDQNKTQLLPEERQAEISALLRSDLPERRASCRKIWEKGGKAKEIDTRKPAWATFATANPVRTKDGAKSIGVRGCIAIHKVPCAYKIETHGEGCSHCGLSLDDAGLTYVPPADQIYAAGTAITNITNALGYTPPVIEFIPDGSSLNDDEISPEARTGIFEIAAKNDAIIKFAIESRPQYITAQEIKRLLSLLRDDQSLEIYIGLESTDPFVLNEIIKKGFTISQFENKIMEIAEGLTPEEKKRFSFCTYHLFKPPYLGEKESIEAAVAMGSQIKEYEAKTGIHFSVKYEPTVISDTT